MKAAVEKDAATSYAPFKMKGHTLPGINQRTEETNSSAFQLVDDIKNPVAGASAMKIHDGKKFEDAGFMDTHFPSGKARTPAKKRHDKIKQDEKDKKTIEEDKIVRRMKQLEKHMGKTTVERLYNTSAEEQNDLYTLIHKVIGWHYDRNLIEGSTDKDQVLKLAQELGELSDSVCKGKDVKDDIGDMLVVMLNIAERNGVILAECLQKAWDDIKDRKGKMVDGIFVKEADLK